jgi:chaperonin cofactor prefoldin
MPDNIDYLLSENFIEFSKNIADIFSEKKKKKEHLKQIYEKIQLEIKELDNKAKKLNSEFEAWKSSFENNEKTEN